MSELILYDLPSKGHCACWSPNPWKARLALNYKRLPYSTHWLEYPAVAPTLKSFGLPPNTEGTPYTIPAMRFPDGTYMMDSRAIATELERRHPSPSLHLDAEMLPEVEALIGNVMKNMRGVLFPKYPPMLLNEVSVEYFVRTREERFGMSMAELEKKEGGEGAWERVKPIFEELGAILKKKGGPFVLGREVSYADFVIVGLLQFTKRCDEDVYGRVAKMEPALNTLYEASAAWVERDDH